MFGPINPHYLGLTLVYRAAGMLQAEVIKGQLETAGIPVMLDYESLGRVYGFTVDGLGEVRVLVPDERAEDARQLLESSASDEAGTAPGQEDDTLQT
jgi:hypothetical protein